MNGFPSLYFVPHHGVMWEASIFIAPRLAKAVIFYLNDYNVETLCDEILWDRENVENLYYIILYLINNTKQSKLI